MQKLHLVGFTPDLDGLILSTRKGAKSGSFLVSLDPAVLKQLVDMGAPDATESSVASRTNGAAPKHPRESRPESQLGPREMQELLRGGWTLEEVAAEGGVDVDWVSRFAAPVLAEMRLVLDQARESVFERPRVGLSALPLAASVRRNIAERGVRFTDEEFDEGWRAHQLEDLLWVVGFDYQSRGKRQSAEWTIDLETGEIVSRGRLGTQLGHVQSARRRVDLTPLPKAKTNPAAGRAVRAPVEAPAPRTAPTKAAPSNAIAPVQRPRARRSARAAAPTKKVAQPRKAEKPHAADPWREELRRRELERSAAHAPQSPRPERSPARPAARPAPPSPVPEASPARPFARPAPSSPVPEHEPELSPVAIIGPTVRTLAPRPPARRERAPEPPAPEPPAPEPPGPEPPGPEPPTPSPPPPPTPPRSEPSNRDVGPEPTTGPTPHDRNGATDLRWSPKARKPPQPPPELPLDTSSPAAPVFKGAQSAADAAPIRRRRSEPLRAR